VFCLASSACGTLRQGKRKPTPGMSDPVFGMATIRVAGGAFRRKFPRGLPTSVRDYGRSGNWVYAYLKEGEVEHLVVSSRRVARVLVVGVVIRGGAWHVDHCPTSSFTGSRIPDAGDIVITPRNHASPSCGFLFRRYSGRLRGGRRTFCAKCLIMDLLHPIFRSGFAASLRHTPRVSRLSEQVGTEGQRGAINAMIEAMGRSAYRSELARDYATPSWPRSRRAPR